MVMQSGGWSFEPNYKTVTRPEDLLEALGDVLVDAGWTLINASDGTTVGTSRLTSADWDNSDAWEHYRDPSGTGGRDISIQHNGVTSSRIFMSLRGDPMTGGTPTVAPTPTGTRGEILSAAAQGYQNWLENTAGTQTWHIGAASAAYGETDDVYPFYCIRRDSPSGNATGTPVLLVPVRTTADGTTGDADAEPWVCFTGANLPGASCSGWFKAGLTGESFVRNGLRVVEESVGQFEGLNPYRNDYDRWVLLIDDDTGGLEQRKGIIDPRVMCRRGAGSHTSYDTYNLTTEAVDSPVTHGAMLVLDFICFRWPHNVAPVA